VGIMSNTDIKVIDSEVGSPVVAFQYEVIQPVSIN
jgi:hypothetical protein